MTEWGCFQYMVIPFGLKNSLAIFSTILVASFKYFIHKFLEVYFDDLIVFGHKIPYSEPLNDVGMLSSVSNFTQIEEMYTLHPFWSSLRPCGLLRWNFG